MKGAFAEARGVRRGKRRSQGRVALFLGRSQGGKRRLQGEAAFAGRKGRSQERGALFLGRSLGQETRV